MCIRDSFYTNDIREKVINSYIEVICNKYTGNNTLKVGFEGAVKRIADL